MNVRVNITLAQILAHLAALGAEEVALAPDDHRGRAAERADAAATMRMIPLAIDLPEGPAGQLLVMAAEVAAKRWQDVALVHSLMAESGDAAVTTP